MFNYLGLMLLLKLCSCHDASSVNDTDKGSELLGLGKQSQQQGLSQLAAQDGVRDSTTKLPGSYLQSQVVAKSGVKTNIKRAHSKSSYFSDTNLKSSGNEMKIMQPTAENVVMSKNPMLLSALPSISSLVASTENSAVTQTEHSNAAIITSSNSFSGVASTSDLHGSTNSEHLFSTDGTHILSTPIPSKLSDISSTLSKSNSNTTTVHSNSSVAEISSLSPGISMASNILPNNPTSHMIPSGSVSSEIPLHNASSMQENLSPVLSSMEAIANATSIPVISILPASTQSLTTSSAPSISVNTSVHWRTVTVCPWDTLSPASALQSTLMSSQESLQASNVSLASTTSLSTVITPLILSSAISESSMITQSPAITQSSVISPSAAWKSILLPSFSVISNQSDIKPIARKGCRVVLNGLSQVMGNMTFCILNNLRPLEVCGKCTKVYSEMEEYQNLIARTANCENELVTEFNSQYQAIPKMYAFQKDLWKDFECEKCYADRPKGIPYAPWTPKSQFAQSSKLVKQIMTCFANYSSSISVPYPVMLNVSQRINATSWKSTTKICTECKHLYREIKKYMKSIHYEGSTEKRWCADMVYGFNETRRIWGAICVEEKQNSESIIALTCFFCFIPVIFYIGTKLHSDVKERKNESRVNYESE